MKTPAASRRKTVAREKPRTQYAALPYRRSPDVEILMVTSRETGRWVIPKGWPMKGRSGRKAAEREAFEEAGLVGRTAKAPLGRYDYLKLLPSGEAQLCRVTVFAMGVEHQLAAWPEQDQRTAQWFGWEAAAAAVQEPELAEIIRTFALAESGAVIVGN